MLQDSPREADTVRLHPDGTVGRGRPTPPPSAGPGADRPSAAVAQVPAAAPSPGPAVDGPVAPPVSDTQVIGPAVDPAVDPAPEPGPEDTVVVGRVPATTTDAAEPSTEPTDSPADPSAVESSADGPTPVDDPAAADGSAGGPGEPPVPAGAPGGRSWWRRRSVLVPAAAAALALGAAYGVDLLAAGDHVPRGTVVAGVDLGGLSPAAATQRLQSDLAPRVAADHTLVADDVHSLLHPPSAGIGLDVPATLAAVEGQPLNPLTRFTSLFSDRAVDAVLTADQTSLNAQVEQLATTVDRAPVDATITLEGTTPTLVEPVPGRILDRAGAAHAITAALAAGGDPSSPIDLPVKVAEVRVAAAEARRVLDTTVTPALSAPVTVVGTNGAHSVDLPVTAIAASLTFTPTDDGTLAVAIDPAALQTAMGAEFAAFGSPAKDARFEVSGNSVSVVPSVDGQGINPTDLATQLLPVLDDPAPRTVTANLGPVPAAFTTEEAQSLGITEKVSSFTTTFSNTASGTNIRVVAEKVDGAVVRPGDTFSLNGYTGPRGTAQGYVPAAVISGGELSQAVGGGISQFATTMFNAVFFAGLEDVHHQPHSFYISRYPAGREATVYEGLIDLQWRNDSDTGIYVQTQWAPGSITVTFWGRKHYDIESVSSERRNFREPAVQDKVDDGKCIPQAGSQGFDITVTRVFRNLTSGAELRRENFNTHYAAEAIIHCIPPADPAAGQPATGGTTPPATPTGRRPGARVAEDVRARIRRRRR